MGSGELEWLIGPLSRYSSDSEVPPEWADSLENGAPLRVGSVSRCELINLGVLKDLEQNRVEKPRLHFLPHDIEGALDREGSPPEAAGG